MADLVRYEINDRVAVITIDNPPVNALSPAVWDGIDQAVQRASGDAVFHFVANEISHIDF